MLFRLLDSSKLHSHRHREGTQLHTRRLIGNFLSRKPSKTFHVYVFLTTLAVMRIMSILSRKTTNEINVSTKLLTSALLNPSAPLSHVYNSAASFS